MSQIEDNLMHALGQWYKSNMELIEAKRRESVFRFTAFNLFFPNAKEGTTTYPIDLAMNVKLKGVRKINRSVDEAALIANTKMLRDNGIIVERVFKMKPVLSKSNYNKLTDHQKALVDNCLKISEGAASLEVHELP